MEFQLKSKKNKRKKILFVATVTSHIKAFHISCLKLLKEQGYEVHVASNGNENIEYCDKHFNIPFQRNPIKKENIQAYKKLKEIIEKNNYDIIHCHTPVGGVLTRIAAKRSRNNGTKVFYTAHGFHFYKGAPLLNWLIYYPIEKYLSRYTDCLITINQEDYNIAKRKFKKCKHIELIDGVGLDVVKFTKNVTNRELEKLRDSIGICSGNIVITYVAELNKNKNQIMLIKTLEELIKENNMYVLILVGDGPARQDIEKYLEKRNLKQFVKLLGKRNDVYKILKLTDIYVASSLREGLPVNILEAMYIGLPIVATDNRGHRELIKNNKNGFIINNVKDMKNKIEYIKSNEKILINAQNNTEIVKQRYTVEKIVDKMKKIYLGEI